MTQKPLILLLAFPQSNTAPNRSELATCSGCQVVEATLEDVMNERALIEAHVIIAHESVVNNPIIAHVLKDYQLCHPDHIIIVCDEPQFHLLIQQLKDSQSAMAEASPFNETGMSELMGFFRLCGRKWHLEAIIDEMRNEFEYQLRHCPKTGNPNQIKLEEDFNEWQNKHDDGLLALLVIAFDNLDIHLDYLSDTEVTELYQAIALRIEWLAGNESRVYQTNSNEFCLIMHSEKQETFGLFGSMLIKKFKQPFMIGSKRLTLLPSLGIAVNSLHGDGFLNVFRNAEFALRQAKQVGNDYRFYQSRYGQNISERVKLYNEIARALKDGEFAFFYQPKVDCLTNQLYGAEALIRWNHPERGVLPPSQFIEVVENSEYIYDLGQSTLQRILNDFKTLDYLDLSDFEISYNVCVKELLHHRFLENFQQYYPMIRERLTLQLEVTESLFVADFKRVSGLMQLLQNMGLRIAIDDFGTGYSSLSRLIRMPIDTLKIDRSFITALSDNEQAISIIRAMIGLGKQLGLEIVAEGVETETERNTLLLEGCHHVQGYYYYPPLPFSQLTLLLEQSRPKRADADPLLDDLLKPFAG